jgi:hypothetical protein
MEIEKMTAADLSEQTMQEQLLPKMIIRDKPCVFTYDPETKYHSSRWHTNILQQKKKLWVTKFQQDMLGTYCRNLGFGAP